MLDVITGRFIPQGLLPVQIPKDMEIVECQAEDVAFHMEYYEDTLLKGLKEKETTENYHGVPILVKNLPDCDVKGAMDPRLYRDSKNRFL